jgi:hypothetical protein
MEMGQHVVVALRAVVAAAVGVPSSAVNAALHGLRAALPAAIDATPELLAIVTGQPLFTADVRLPGMVHAALRRSPWADEHAARMEPLVEAAVRAVPGFIALIRDPALSGPAVVAERPGALERMRAAAMVRWARPTDLDTAAFERFDVDRPWPKDGSRGMTAPRRRLAGADRPTDRRDRVPGRLRRPGTLHPRLPAPVRRHPGHLADPTDRRRRPRFSRRPSRSRTS